MVLGATLELGQQVAVVSQPDNDNINCSSSTVVTSSLSAILIAIGFLCSLFLEPKRESFLNFKDITKKIESQKSFSEENLLVQNKLEQQMIEKMRKTRLDNRKEYYYY